MSEELLKSGVALLQKATALDKAGHVQEAISTYLTALEALIKCHGYEKIENNKKMLKVAVLPCWLFVC